MMVRMELVIVVVYIVALAYAADPPGGYYQSKYDALDVQEILNNKRLVLHYVNCLLSRGACPPQGADLKRILPEALETNCLRCTQKQREVIATTVTRLRTEYPIQWSELVSEYDPDGEYFVRFVLSLDPTANVADQENLLSNRFGEDDFPNDLLPTTPKPTPPPVTTKKTRRPSYTIKTSTRNPTTRTTTITTTTSTTEPAMTRTNEYLLLEIFTTLPPATMVTSKITPQQVTEVSVTTPFTQSTLLTRITKASSPVTDDIPPLSYGWRPTVHGTRVLASRAPHPFFNAENNLLSSIGQIGTRVFQVGSQVAGMVLNAFVGNN